MWPKDDQYTHHKYHAPTNIPSPSSSPDSKSQGQTQPQKQEQSDFQTAMFNCFDFLEKICINAYAALLDCELDDAKHELSQHGALGSSTP